jgi:hypothetical protein
MQSCRIAAFSINLNSYVRVDIPGNLKGPTMHSLSLPVRRLAVFTSMMLCSFIGSATLRADVLLSGFNGDLSSSLGVNWEVRSDVGWLSAFVPSLTEGSMALQITQTKASSNWEPGLKLVGGEALAQLILAHATLEYDVAPTQTMSWRQSFAVLNGNNETVGWNQTPEFNLDTPGQPTHIVVDLAPWKPKAQAWLNETNPDLRTYFELFLGLQGQELGPTADTDFDFDVDGADFITVQQNIGNTAAAQEQGDFNFDFIVDGADVLILQEQFARSTDRVPSTFDNVTFVSAPAVASIPEPSTLGLGAFAIAALAGAIRRPRVRR